MAFRIDSRSRDAGNKLGPTTVAPSDWHREPADFHLGTGHTAPTSDAGYTTASDFRLARTSITPYLREESIYGLLGMPHTKYAPELKMDVSSRTHYSPTL
jgi:hypothetical protein